jgi:hypothetical protein
MKDDWDDAQDLRDADIRSQARAEALEEAARVAECYIGDAFHGEMIAHDIRALKERKL